MRLLTLTEAASFLRMSRSSLYQRKDIPRYRRPGSRVMLFDQDALELKYTGKSCWNQLEPTQHDTRESARCFASSDCRDPG